MQTRIENYYTRLLNNAMKAYCDSKTEWAQDYWLEVISKLAQNIETRKVIH